MRSVLQHPLKLWLFAASLCLASVQADAATTVGDVRSIANPLPIGTSEPRPLLSLCYQCRQNSRNHNPRDTLHTSRPGWTISRPSRSIWT